MAGIEEFIQQIKNSVYRPLPSPQVIDDIAVLNEVGYSVKIGYRNLNLNFYTLADDTTVKPLVIWVHGGAFRFGSRKYPPPFLTVENTYYKIARAGFHLATIDYRFSAEAIWPAQLEDALDAITWLQDRAEELHIDTKKIAVWGESAGAHIAVNAGIRFNSQKRTGRHGQALEPVAAVLDWYGPTDFLLMDQQAPPTDGQPHDDPESPESVLIGAPIQSVPQLVAAANPLNFIDKHSPAFHIRHGEDDHLVAIGQSEILVAELEKHGIPCDFKKIPGADHGFDGMPDSHLLVDEGIEYLANLFS